MAGDANVRTVEGDAGVGVHDRRSTADDPVLVLDGGRDRSDLVAVLLTLAEVSTEVGERGSEERLDVVGLEADSLGAVHLLTDPFNVAGAH